MHVTEEAAKHLARQAIRNPGAHTWDIQGFGMLRTRLSEHLRLNIWDSEHAVPDVSLIHTHPWNFSSVVCWGRLTNHVYNSSEEADIEEVVKRNPNVLHRRYDRYTIKPGPGGGLLSEAHSVWLGEVYLQSFGAGQSYHMSAEQIHRSGYTDGTVTLNYRERVGKDEAYVYELSGKPWVSAEPRLATPEEVGAFMTKAAARYYGDFGEAIYGVA